MHVLDFLTESQNTEISAKKWLKHIRSHSNFENSRSITEEAYAVESVFAIVIGG